MRTWCAQGRADGALFIHIIIYTHTHAYLVCAKKSSLGLIQCAGRAGERIPCDCEGLVREFVGYLGALQMVDELEEARPDSRDLLC